MYQHPFEDYSAYKVIGRRYDDVSPTPVNIPSPFDAIGGLGSDFVVILPTDKNFCRDCAYQMGVTSVSNSSFTISVYRGDEGGNFKGGIRKYVPVSPVLSLSQSTFTFIF